MARGGKFHPYHHVLTDPWLSVKMKRFDASTMFFSRISLDNINAQVRRSQTRKKDTLNMALIFGCVCATGFPPWKANFSWGSPRKGKPDNRFARALQQVYEYIRSKSNVKEEQKINLYLDRFLKVTSSMTPSACQRDLSEANFSASTCKSMSIFTFRPFIWHILFFLRTYCSTQTDTNGPIDSNGNQPLAVQVQLKSFPSTML